MYTLFFEKASKDNQGGARGGRIIYNPMGTFEIHYSWSIGKDTNNMAEAHALWKDLVQMKSQRMTEAMVFGDLHLLIQAMITTPKSSNLKLTNMVKRDW